MIALYRGALRSLRRNGFDVFVIPGPRRGSHGTPNGVSGMAWCSSAGKHINVVGSVHSPLWLFVLFHEFAHHTLGHIGKWTSTPAWVSEKAADDLALRLIRDVQPYAAAKCEQASKAHIRRYLQDMIDAGIWHHVDRETAIWAGCDLPDDPLPHEEPYLDDDLPF